MKINNKTLINNNFIGITDIDRKEVEYIFGVAKEFESIINNKTSCNILCDKILASLFFQPSTRTRLSFDSAMNRLGGRVIGFSDVSSSRAGDPNFNESLEDTSRMINNYANIAVIRHSNSEAALLFAKKSTIPIINGGCGAVSSENIGTIGEHPTQCLLDLYTIYKKRGTLDNLNLLVNGNLSSRGVNSICKSMSLFENCKIFFHCPKELGIPEKLKKELSILKVNFETIEKDGIDDYLKFVDIIYVTSVRKALGMERTPEKYIIDIDKITGKVKKNLIILHPLPRLDELNKNIDDTPYCTYFEQAKNGVPIRMAILSRVLGRV